MVLGPVMEVVSSSLILALVSKFFIMNKALMFHSKQKRQKPKTVLLCVSVVHLSNGRFWTTIKSLPLTIIAVSNRGSPIPRSQSQLSLSPFTLLESSAHCFLNQENQPQFKSIESFLWEKNLLFEKSVVYSQHPCPALSLPVPGSLIFLHQHGHPGNQLYNILLPIFMTSSCLFLIVPFLNLPHHSK